MNCWGWATWADRWEYYKKDVDETIRKFNKKDICGFNLDGAENFWEQVLSNKNRNINTWAIFWYATVFKNNGLCLNPAKTFFENIGHDSSCEHCGNSNSYKNNNLNLKESIDFTRNIKENSIAVFKIKEFYYQENHFIRK